MLIDTHCHLTDERFNDVRKTIADAKRSGIEKIIIPSTNLSDAKKAVNIAETEKQFCLLGIHPEDAEKSSDIDKQISELKKLLFSKHIVGIGEIGLDFYWDREKKSEGKQYEIFEKLMRLAVEKSLPTAIHMREAEDEMKKELEGMERLPEGQFHCFAGSQEFLKWILDKGFYVSFCGNITYKSAWRLRELLKIVPIDRLLLETDSPYLPPEPLRGSVNTPANVKIVAEFMAKVLGMNTEDLASETSKNAKCLYSLDI